MKTLFLLLFTSFLIFAESSKSDTTQKEAIKIPIKSKIPVKIKHNYKMIENTTVSRTFEDGKIYEYERGLTYFYSFWAEGSAKDGILKLIVQVDSLTYNFKDDKENISFYNSQDDVPPTHKQDFLKTFIPNGLEFNMYFDTYGKAIDIDGGTLEYDRKNLVDPKYGIKNDDYRLFTFQNRYSFEDLSHLTDPIKGLVPSKPVARDSAWKSEFIFDINYATFQGIVEPTYYMNVDNHFFIDFETDSLSLKDNYYDMHLEKEVASVISASASGKADLKLSGRGLLKYLDTDFTAFVEGRFRNLKFAETIRQKIRWELYGTYRV